MCASAGRCRGGGGQPGPVGTGGTGGSSSSDDRGTDQDGRTGVSGTGTVETALRQEPAGGGTGQQGSDTGAVPAAAACRPGDGRPCPRVDRHQSRTPGPSVSVHVAPAQHTVPCPVSSVRCPPGADSRHRRRHHQPTDQRRCSYTLSQRHLTSWLSETRHRSEAAICLPLVPVTADSRGIPAFKHRSSHHTAGMGAVQRQPPKTLR